MAYSRSTSPARNANTHQPAGNFNRNNKPQGNQPQGNQSGVQRGTPTDKMLAYAEKIADELGIEMPQDAAENFDACRAFIDANADSVPPTDKQVGLAQRIASSNGARIPADVLASKRKLSAWIDEQNGS